MGMSTALKRKYYEQLKKKYDLLGKGNIRLAESSLFLTQDISATKSVYNFDILETQNATLQTDEIRLNINDEFIACAMGIYLYGTSRNANNTTGASAPQLLTYAPIELDGAAMICKGLYAGVFKYGVNNIVYCEKWRVRKHEYIPQTQFVNLPTPAAGPPVISNSYPATLPNLDYKECGMVELATLLTFSGAKKNEISITLPNAITGLTVTYLDQKGVINYVNITKIAIALDGFNAQNGSSFQGVRQD